MSLDDTHDSTILPTAIEELSQDLKDLKFLLSSCSSQLKRFGSDIHRSAKYILPSTFLSIKNQIQRNEKELKIIYKDLNTYVNQARDKKPSLSAYKKLHDAKKRYYDLFRSQQAIIGALLTSTDWQSPTFIHSSQSYAGSQTGKIWGTINDYKRDVHLDEKNYETEYIKQYVDTLFKFNLHAYLTNSGMAAFTTILTYLATEKKIRGKILIGKSVYFQYKQILCRALGKNIVEIDEMQTENIIKTLEKHQPSVIFFDSLCNAAEIPIPNLTTIFEYIYKNAKKETYIVIDNTCLSTFYQPYKNKKGNKKVHLLVFESLNKYYQFGLDRVTAGIIIAQGKDASGIFEYRKHAGTNITDSSVYVLPKPNRKRLENRLIRHQRNACLLASSLHDHIAKNKKSPVAKIIYPGLSHHPAYKWTCNLSFKGSFFNICFKSRYQSVRNLQRFVNIVIDTAKKEDVDIAAGTSFGLNTTRIYLTSLRTDYGQPFMRISAGIEDIYQLYKIKKVFIKSLTKFSRFSL